jgi:soluble lytic murein transglycosylase-like protein
MSITPNQEEDGRPHGHPPTAVQCALALVTAGLAVAAAMLALIGTAQANYRDALPEDYSYLQGPLSSASNVQASSISTPPLAQALCPPTLPATYNGTVRVDGQPITDALTLTASIDGEAWATAIISDGRYTIDIPQDTPDTAPCFPGSGTIVFTLDGYTCMPAEEREGTGWVALGYRSFAPGLYDIDLVCLATPSPDDAIGDAALDDSLEAAAADSQSWQAQLDSAWASRAAWKQMLDAFPNSEYRTQAHLWLAKIDQALLSYGEGAPYSDSFYGPQTQAWLENQDAVLSGGPEEIIQAPVAPDWDAVEGWLTSLWGPEPLATESALFDSTAWQSGLEFHQSGLQREATETFLRLIDESSLQPWSLYRLARAFDDLDMPHLAARTATRLLWWTADSPLEQIPRALVELAYPLAYPSLVQAAAAEYNLSPLLLLALIRQESFFNPLAVSSAGALGLTQVMPPTGQGIAAALNVEGFSTSDLLQPQVSIRFGAYYLRSQLDSSAGNLLFALAAYNAGPDNARRWTASLPIPDMDLFIELIDFAETRSYVKLVLENYAVYRFLYANADQPTLLTEPDEPFLLPEPGEPTLPTEPSEPAPMIGPDEPAPLIGPDEPVLMIEPDQPALLTEPEELPQGP